MKKTTPKECPHYKSLNDELNWDNVNFPSSDVDIDTLEENNGGKVAINVYFIVPPKKGNTPSYSTDRPRFKEQLIKSVF